MKKPMEIMLLYMYKVSTITIYSIMLNNRWEILDFGCDGCVEHEKHDATIMGSSIEKVVFQTGIERIDLVNIFRHFQDVGKTTILPN